MNPGELQEGFTKSDYFNYSVNFFCKNLSKKEAVKFIQDMDKILKNTSGNKLLLHTTRNEHAEEILENGLDFKELRNTTDYLPNASNQIDLLSSHLNVRKRRLYGKATIIIEYNRRFFDYIENPEIYMKHTAHYGNEDLDQDEDEVYYRTPKEFVKGYIDMNDKKVYFNKYFNPNKDPSKYEISNKNNENFSKVDANSVDSIVESKINDENSKFKFKSVLTNIVSYLF